MVGHAAKGKKRARSDTSEAGVSDNDSLSKQIAAQLITSAQAGKPRASKAITAPQAPAASASVLGGLKQTQAKSELQHASSAQPTAKKGKTSNAISSKLTATSCPPGNIQAPSVPATQQPAVVPAAGEPRPDATAPKGKQGKLGRNARLRLKRQAHRQQALLSSTSDCETTAEAATAQPAAHLSKKSKAARADSLPAITQGKSSSAQGSAAQSVSVNDSQMATLAKPAGSSVKQGQKLATSAASPTRSAQKADSLPAAKLKKTGLLEQMRSKLSGGRFRMLNEQLYTTEGQHAYHMMQAQPDLYQQYHEVCTCPTCLSTCFVHSGLNTTPCRCIHRRRLRDFVSSHVINSIWWQLPSMLLYGFVLHVVRPNGCCICSSNAVLARRKSRPSCTKT